MLEKVILTVVVLRSVCCTLFLPCKQTLEVRLSVTFFCHSFSNASLSLRDQSNESALFDIIWMLLLNITLMMCVARNRINPNHCERWRAEVPIWRCCSDLHSRCLFRNEKPKKLRAHGGQITQYSLTNPPSLHEASQVFCPYFPVISLWIMQILNTSALTEAFKTV